MPQQKFYIEWLEDANGGKYGAVRAVTVNSQTADLLREALVEVTEAEVEWYMQAVDRLEDYEPSTGLQLGDYILQVLITPGHYAAATTLSSLEPLQLADRFQSRLMLWNDQEQKWFPVMP